MAIILHKNLPDAQLHECKGAAGASSGKVPIATGAGAATFRYINPRGAIHFVNVASPYVLTYPSAFTKLAPTTVASGTAIECTEASTARLTYTGTGNIQARIIANLSIDQSIGANRDLELSIYKNGTIVAGSNIVTTAPSGMKQLITSMIDVTLTTNDYVEAFIKNNGASGDVNVYTYFLSMSSTRS